MRWARYVAGTGEVRDAYRFMTKNLTKENHLEDLDMAGTVTQSQNAESSSKLTFL